MEDLCPIKSPSMSRMRKPHKAQNIFFLETSGESCLTARQACSVESAARSNPYAMISVHMENSGYQKQTKIKAELAGQKRNCAISNRLFKEWNNVKLVREDLLQHLRNTTLWRLYEKAQLSQSIHPLTHRSDAVRVAMLWKFGGLYLDLDCLVFRPLYCLQNTVGLVDFLPNCNIIVNVIVDL
jgi:lactosylceramide 4-alpha-galactosyltransferase